MVLKVKGNKEKVDEIEFQENGDAMLVQINGEVIAVFYDNGDFTFHGQNRNKYMGKWNE